MLGQCRFEHADRHLSDINIPVIFRHLVYTTNAEERADDGSRRCPGDRSITSSTSGRATVSGGRVKIYLQPGASLDTANAQVASASQWTPFMPAGTPPRKSSFSASSVPVLHPGVSGKLTGRDLNDLSFASSTQLITVPGAVVPLPYGGKQRQVNINLDPRLLQSKGLAPQDVLNAVAQQTPILPSGGAKIGQFEYDVRLRASPQTVDAYNDLPIRLAGGSPVYVRDVAHVRDGFGPQTTHRAAGRPPRRPDERAEGRQRVARRREGYSRILPARQILRLSW
jgi:multidrug efflux pump subunit AcrB